MVIQLVWSKTTVKPTETIEEMLARSKTAPKTTVKPIVGKRPDKTIVTPRVNNAIKFLHGGENGNIPQKRYKDSADDEDSVVDETSSSVNVDRQTPTPMNVWMENLKESVSKYSCLIDEVDKEFSSNYKVNSRSSETLRFLVQRSLKPHRDAVIRFNNKMERFKQGMEKNAQLEKKVEEMEAKLDKLEAEELKNLDPTKAKRLGL